MSKIANVLMLKNERSHELTILDGDMNYVDFEWNWYQHAPPIIMPNGNIMMFDNGGNTRNYTGTREPKNIADRSNARSGKHI